jgi:hypothetical protein
MKSWQEKFDTTREPVVKVLDTDFADMKAGQKMLISSPREIAAYLRSIPSGSTISLRELRTHLAKKAGADMTCPVTSGIFLRIISERSLELMAEGKEPLAPFWRIVEPGSPLAKKLPISPGFIEEMRERERS